MFIRRLLSLLLVAVLLTSLMPISFAASKTYTGTIVKDKIIFRAKATTSSSVLLRFKKGDKITISGITGDFYNVTFRKIKGFVMRKFVDVSAADKKALEKAAKSRKETETETSAVTKAADDGMQGITKISQIKVPSTTKKGDKGASVKSLQQALKLKKYYKADINSKFDDATVKAVKAYQKANRLTENGQADFATIKKLFGKNAADFKYKTEKLDWFDGGSKVIPRGATFTVKDVATGKTFKCKRLYGANHMDTEPLNADATETLKKIYGGKWSWNRRAVLVMYKGHVYAGSMNGMPHGNCSITNNGFDGHFCIHFTGSMTHGSKKVDSGHQNAVKRALRATW